MQKEKKELMVVNSIALDLLRKATGLGEVDLREGTTFESINLESLAITAFISSLEPYFQNLSKTFIFDCRSILDVSAYLLKQHADDVKKLVISQDAQSEPDVAQNNNQQQLEDVDWPELTALSDIQKSEEDQAIAIIGMQGHFPEAETLDLFWKNLYEGKNSISEIPSERWPLENFYLADTESRKTGLSYAKWGGFLKDIDSFDTQFFGVSSREASQMDPQERIFLECAWHAMEDAALFGERAVNLKEGDSYNVGVFVGLTTNTYSLLAPDHWRQGGTNVPAAVPWSAANRVSYGLNLSGPSMAIDTACSSSLVALHLACESLIKGECKAAIAGGVNLYCHPTKYIQLCQLQMLSPTGRCHTFGQDADGFVPGEGVGAIILKPLANAKNDGDRILGVIRGTSVNHSGRTNGYTVPSAQSQTELIQTALDACDLPSSSIGYVEAHGTGTKLGDPIEFSALTKTLAGKTAVGPCGLGSVKSNIGHLESAAGTAGIIKVLLQLKHKCILPSLGAKKLNPALDMKGSRFFVPQKPTHWEPDAQTGIRRAGVSSFGAGGANSHVIIEEAPESKNKFQDSDVPLIIPVSARSKDQLNALVKCLLEFIRSTKFNSNASAKFSSLAYILQCGRQHHSFRFVTIAATVEELEKNLITYIEDTLSNEQDLKLKERYASYVRPDEEFDVEDQTEDLQATAQTWLQGGRVSWGKLWYTTPPIIDVPLYPFAKESHWIRGKEDDMTLPGIQSIQLNPEQKMHGVLTFTGQELFLLEHQIDGKPIFPAAAYFNYFYGILKQHGLEKQLSFQDITWFNPFRPDGEQVKSMVWKKSEDGSNTILEFLSPDHKTIYCRVQCNLIGQSDTSKDSLIDVRARCVKAVDAKDCYPIFDKLNMSYGPTFRSMQSALVSEMSNEALVEVRLSRALKEKSESVTNLFDPGMLDGIFQSSFIFSLNEIGTVGYQFIPYNLKSANVYGKLGEQVYVHVKQKPEVNNHRVIFEYTIYSASGDVVMEINDFSFRKISAAKLTSNNDEKEVHQIHQFKPIWTESILNPQEHAENEFKTVIFDDTPNLYQALCESDPTLKVHTYLVLPSKQFKISDINIIEMNCQEQSHLQLLWRMFLDEGGLPKQIIFNRNKLNNHDLNTSWEAQASLGNSKALNIIIRSFCESTTSPKFHIQVNHQSIGGNALFGAATSGFLRALNQEIPLITANIVASDQEGDFTKNFAQDFLLADRQGVQEIKWQNGKRYIRRLCQNDVTANRDTYISTANDVIVITGGAGAVARSLASSLATTPGMCIALVGRSDLDASISEFIDQFASKNISVSYWQSDCADRNKLSNTLDSIRNQLGPISGVLHCAGILKDDFFMRQDEKDWDKVLKAKILGALWLDELTHQDQLKWFVLCSALASVRGNIGQSTYGLANAWLNAFSENRQLEVEAENRQGKTIAVGWPLWETADGMQPPKEIINHYAKKGLTALTKAEGAAIFLNALKVESSQVIVPIKGEKEAIERFLNIKQDSASEPNFISNIQNRKVNNDDDKSKNKTPNKTATQTEQTEEALIAYLAVHLESVTGTATNKINADVPLEAFGLDSILVMELNELIEKDFPNLSKTVLFEARSLRLLAKLLIDEHEADAITIREKAIKPQEQPSTLTESLPRNHTQQVSSIEVKESISENTKGDSIAVIGVAGRYPGASDLNQLWEHLTAGNDLISEIPDRWETQSDTYAKWGGFLDDYDRFDPLFFGISPRDAERMDPQERLFLQTAWHTVENAGYTPEALSGGRGTSGDRKRVGVIVGVMYGEYQLFGVGADAGNTIANSSYASIANRVSYCLDFDGPSFAIDSMCSSSLTSISLACDQLRGYRCDAVIAGGVNLSIHPNKYNMLCELNFASTDGRCRSFGEGGDGYVPGEGVGAVLLKRLEDAERDGDYIYAVIQGSDIGHGAKTSGYTVPNADAQSEVVHRAFERSGLAPSRLSYLEAHGTGTSLGDPIEIRGVTKALASQFSSDQKCPIGSIKSNIGHLESAAGIAALTKVLLQLEHNQLAPSIHSNNLNQNIDFSKTPFFIQQELTPWEADDISPRVAAVSSFGAGGANAHIVIEEHLTKQTLKTTISEKEVFLFSAKSLDQLNDMAKGFIKFLDREMLRLPNTESHHVMTRKFTISDVAITLEKGRKHLPKRLAISVTNFSALYDLLIQFSEICDQEDAKDKLEKLESTSMFYGDVESSNIVQAEMELRGLDAHDNFAEAWVNDFEKTRAMSMSSWRKVPLPGYVFLRNRYWVDEKKSDVTNSTGQNVDISIQPNVILERVANGELDYAEARTYLLSMSNDKDGEAKKINGNAL